MSAAPLQFLLMTFAGWVNRRQLAMIDYLKEENLVLRQQLGGGKLRFTDDQRRRLAVKGRALGRRVLDEIAGLVTPDTILRWYRELIAAKYDGTARRGAGRPGTASPIRELVVRFATENPTWGYTRIRDVLGNLGHVLARNTIKRILLDHGLEPAPLARPSDLERHHQGLDNQLITPPPLAPTPANDNFLVVRRERLGGLLNYYHRRAA